MDIKSKGILDYRDNPDLRDIFGGKEVGSDGVFTVRYTITKNDDNGLEFNVVAVSDGEADVDDFDDEDNEDVADTSIDEPAALILSAISE